MGRGTPPWKVYTADREYIASVRYPLDAALLVANRPGYTVRFGHTLKDIVWREGAEAFSAGDSWSKAAEVMVDNLRILREKRDQEYEEWKAKRGV